MAGSKVRALAAAALALVAALLSAPAAAAVTASGTACVVSSQQGDRLIHSEVTIVNDTTVTQTILPNLLILGSEGYFFTEDVRVLAPGESTTVVHDEIGSGPISKSYLSFVTEDAVTRVYFDPVRTC